MNSLSDNQPQQLPRVSVQNRNDFSILDDRSGTWKWIIITGSIAILVPLIIFLVNSLALKTPPLPGEANIAFHIGSLSVAWYGIFIFFGFASAIAIACIKLWKLYKVSIDPFYWFCLMGIPTAILGARFWSCAIGDAQWNSFFDFHSGGLAIEGGVVFTIILACWWFPFILKYPKYQVRDLSIEPNKVSQVSFLAYVDAIVPAILIGQIIGRYGNYQNQELYGAVISSGSYTNTIQNLFPLMNINGIVHQPLFFYESCLNWIGLAFIFFACEFIPKKRIGDMGFIYFLWYGILRLSLEPLRDSQFSFASTYVMSGLWVALAITLLVLNHTIFVKLRQYSLVSTIKNKKLTLKTFDQTLYYLGR